MWWLRLGIKIERIRSGHLEENACHERIHRTLKMSIKPAASGILQQQERFDDFMSEYNKGRLHEVLRMRTSAQVCGSLERRYKGLPDLSYLLHDKEQVVIGG